MAPKKFYIYDEVVIHNKKLDFWVVIHRNVLDLTTLIKDRLDHWNYNMEYLMAFGGKDLSYMFHKGGRPKTEISVRSGRPRVLFPPILEVALSDLSRTKGKIWSQDPMYHIGWLTRRERRIRIVNTLTTNTTLMKVCDEDRIMDIQRKYLLFYNHHAMSYLWRKFSQWHGDQCELELECTLDENGLKEKPGDDTLPPPAIFLYYTDDLTVA